MSEGITLVEDSTGFTFHIQKAANPTHQLSLFSSEFLERFDEPLLSAERLLVIYRQYHNACAAAINKELDVQKATLAADMRPKILAISRWARHKRFQAFRASNVEFKKKVVTESRRWGFKINISVDVADTERRAKTIKEFVAKEKSQARYSYVFKGHTDVSDFIESVINQLSWRMSYSYEIISHFKEVYEAKDIPETMSMAPVDVRKRCDKIGEGNAIAVNVGHYTLDLYGDLISKGLCSIRAAKFLSKNVALHFPTEFVSDLAQLKEVEQRIATCGLHVQRKAALVAQDVPALPVELQAILDTLPPETDA